MESGSHESCITSYDGVYGTRCFLETVYYMIPADWVDKQVYGAYQNVICSTCIDISGVHLFHVYVYYMLDLACVQSIN